MKKLLSLILAGSMLFSLAACGGSSESKDDDSDKKNSSDIVENNGGVGEENDDFVADKGDSDADFSDTQVGDYITFGSYEQDNDLSNGKEPIEWLVLDKQDGRILVISKYALDAKPYNDEYVDVTWETCTLRSWLNDEFINEAFTSGEQAKIQSSIVTAEENTSYDNDPGNETQDKVFLLSVGEAEDYFYLDSERVCELTMYAEANIDMEDHKSNCWWWLRSSGEFQNCATFVRVNGSINYNGNEVYDYDYVNNYDDRVDIAGAAVRPAMWIEL